MSIERIGVIGAGQMGSGIAHVLSLAGYDVVLDDINTDALAKRHRPRSKRTCSARPARGLIKEEEIAPALKRIRTTQTLDDMQDRDLVIEAATEDEAIKKKIFQDLCPRLSRQGDDRHQHLVDFGDAAGRRRPTGRSISSACIS